MDERKMFIRLGQDAFDRGMLDIAIMYNYVAIRIGFEMLDANKLAKQRK